MNADDSTQNQTNTVQPETLPSVPDAWPGAFGAYKYSKAAVMPNVWTVVGLWLLSIIIGGALSEPLHYAGDALSVLVGSLFTAALTAVFIAGVRRQKLDFGAALSKGFSLWLQMIILTILLLVSYVVSFFLLIVPFFFVYPRLVLANYFLVDRGLSPVEAYKASWAATEGHAGKAWGIVGATIAMVLLMVTVIGIPFSIYFLIMYSAAYAVLYEYVQKAEPAAMAPAQAS